MKNNNIIGFIWLGLALVLTLLLFRGLGIPNGKPISFNIGNGSGIFERKSETPKENTFPATELKKIALELKGTSVEISTSEDSDIHVDFSGGAEERCKVKMDGGRLSVEEKAKGLPGGMKQKISIRIPSGKADYVNIEIISGSVQMEGIVASTADVDSVSGSLQLSNCKIKYLDVESVSGSTSADGEFEQFSVESISGSVKISSGIPIAQKGRIESTSGSVKLRLPRDSDYKLEYESISGSFHDDISGTHSSKRGTLKSGNGSVPISVSTISGSLHIE